MPNRILIVEDEAPIARMIAMNLRAAGMEPVVFTDPIRARETLAADHDYDLALLDVMMPGLSGFELMEALKPYGVPVIFLTARDDLEAKLTGLTGGAEDYIVKPFQVPELLVRMDKVLARGRGQEDVIHFRDLEVNLAQRRVLKAGEEVALKPMEFDLLAALLKNRNRAVSREDLIALVWGANYLGETRTVDVHIGQLRKKLGLAESIRTVPKVGYRLED